jgi:DNA-binding transcriptional ArsR family regulator
MSNNQNTDLEIMAGMFKALANPHRLQIFLRLISCCPPGESCGVDRARACVGDLGADIGVAPSTVSHHIKELRQAGLVQVSRVGQRIECWVPAETLSRLFTFFGNCCVGETFERWRLPTATTEIEVETDEL